MKNLFYSFLAFLFIGNYFRCFSTLEKMTGRSRSRKFLSIAGILAVFLCSAQQNNELTKLNTKIDSLQKVLKTAGSDTTRASIYVALSEELYLSDIDTVLPLCLKAIQIADAAISKANKAEKKSFLISKANALNNIGYVYKQQGDITRALEWYNKSVKIQEEIGDKKGFANSINNIGQIYNVQGDNRKAIECYKKSLKIQNEIGDKQGASVSLSNIGLIYNNQGDIPNALEYYSKGLKIQDEIGNKHGVGISLHNIGHLYSTQGNFPMALEYYHKSLKILEEIGDKKGIAALLNSIGILYKDQGVAFFETSSKDEYFFKALDFYNKSLKIREEINDKAGIAGSFNNIGEIYYKQAEVEQIQDSIINKFEKALEWNLKCLVIWEEIGNKQGISNSQYVISGIYLKQANSMILNNRTDLLLKKAEEFCLLSLKLSKELEFPINIRDASERLCIIYKKMGAAYYNSGNMRIAAEKFKDAMEMQDLFKLTADKINNVEMQKSILKKQMQFEFKKKEGEAKAKQDEKDAKAKREKEKQFFQYSAAGIL